MPMGRNFDCGQLDWKRSCELFKCPVSPALSTLSWHDDSWRRYNDPQLGHVSGAASVGSWKKFADPVWNATMAAPSEGLYFPVVNPASVLTDGGLNTAVFTAGNYNINADYTLTLIPMQLSP
jgi:hypothetical protein